MQIDFDLQTHFQLPFRFSRDEELCINLCSNFRSLKVDANQCKLVQLLAGWWSNEKQFDRKFKICIDFYQLEFTFWPEPSKGRSVFYKF